MKSGLKNISRYEPADVSSVPVGYIWNVKYDVDIVSCETFHGQPAPKILS